VALDANSNVYFPNHVNTYGNLGTSPTATNCTGPCGAISGTDNAGTVLTSGTTVTVNFGQAFNVAPFCAMQEVAGTVAPTFTTVTTAIIATVVVTAKNYNWLCFGY
jgi:hypothetical protein